MPTGKFTSDPKRLSADIRQKDSSAWWKAGDNFLKYHQRGRGRKKEQIRRVTEQVLWLWLNQLDKMTFKSLFYIKYAAELFKIIFEL